MLFVLINAHEPLDAAVGLALRIVAVIALAVLIVLAILASRHPHGRFDQANQFYNARWFWLIVAVEVVLLAAGIAVLRVLDARDEANVAWIALVVGVHLVAFLAVWRERSIVVAGVILAALGIAGLAMAGTSAVEWTPLVSGVFSGETLLGFSIWYTGREVLRVAAHP